MMHAYEEMVMISVSSKEDEFLLKNAPFQPMVFRFGRFNLKNPRSNPSTRVLKVFKSFWHFQTFLENNALE